MAKITNALILCALSLTFSSTPTFSQTTQIDSLKNLVNSLRIDRNEAIAEMELGYETAKKEIELERTALDNRLQEQQLAEANFQLIAILFISIITVAFIITFYFLKSKRNIAEREAQKLLIEALEKRLFELQLKQEGSKKTVNINQVNQELKSPLTENEIALLQFAIAGLPNSEIAEKLIVSTNTIKFQLKNIYQKLGSKDKKAVVNYVVKSL